MICNVQVTEYECPYLFWKCFQVSNVLHQNCKQDKSEVFTSDNFQKQNTFKKLDINIQIQSALEIWI